MTSLDPEYNPWVTMSICSLGPSTLNKKEAKLRFSLLKIPMM